MLQKIGKRGVLGSGAGELTPGTGFSPLAQGSILQVVVAFGDFRAGYSPLWVRTVPVPQLASCVRELHAVPGEGETWDHFGERNHAREHPAGTSAFAGVHDSGEDFSEWSKMKWMGTLGTPQSELATAIF